ncbi:hypothetical protein KAI46_08020 [bacterium]|nr:hypothetical protein [bacterium]
MIKTQELKGRLNGPEILDRMHDAGLNISKWCAEREIPAPTFYRILNNQFGVKRNAKQTRRVYVLLKELGYLVENPPTK